MKPIRLRPTIIDIPFVNDQGEEILKLHFDRSDENIKRFFAAIPGIEKKVEEIEKQAEEAENEADIKFDEMAFMKDIADSFLGDGAFEKIHALNDSVFTAAKYVMQIAIGIKEEIEEEDKRAVFDKYK